MSKKRILLALLFTGSAISTAAATEVEEWYPNGGGESLQQVAERICDDLEGELGHRVTIHIAPGTYTEQVSTTIACKKDVSWRFLGAGIGETVFFLPAGFKSKFRGLELDTVFSGVIACGRNPAAKPDGTHSCAATDVFCLMSSTVDGVGVRFTPHTTSCEVSDVSFRTEAGRGKAAVLAAWSKLVLRNVQSDGFWETQLGCLNCKDLDIQHVELTCPPVPPTAITPAGISISVNGNWPGQWSSGARIEHADIQDCKIGILAARQTGADFNHNRIVRTKGTGSGAVLLSNVLLSTIAFNHFSSNEFSIRRDCATAAGQTEVEHNLKFGPGTFLATPPTCGQTSNEDPPVTPEGDPQGW